MKRVFNSFYIKSLDYSVKKALLNGLSASDVEMIITKPIQPSWMAYHDNILKNLVEIHNIGKFQNENII
jgi:hypothetical protein